MGVNLMLSWYAKVRSWEGVQVALDRFLFYMGVAGCLTII